MLADQRRPSRDPPRRAVIDRRLARIDEAAAKLGMLHLLPETAIVQVSVLEQRLRGTHRAPGEAAFLRGVVDFLGRQAGNEAGDEIVDDVGRVRRDDRLVLVLGVLQIAGHAVAVQQFRQVLDEPGVQPASHQRADIDAVLGAELGARRGASRMMAARLTLQHLAAVNVVGDRRLGRQRTRLVYRRIDILPAPGDGSVHQCCHDGHVGEVTTHMPGVAATGRDRRRIRHIRLVIAAGGHLAARRHVQQVAGKIIPPWTGLAERRQRTHDQPGIAARTAIDNRAPATPDDPAGRFPE